MASNSGRTSPPVALLERPNSVALSVSYGRIIEGNQSRAGAYASALVGCRQSTAQTLQLLELKQKAAASLDAILKYTLNLTPAHDHLKENLLPEYKEQAQLYGMANAHRQAKIATMETTIMTNRSGIELLSIKPTETVRENAIQRIKKISNKMNEAFKFIGDTARVILKHAQDLEAIVIREGSRFEDGEHIFDTIKTHVKYLLNIEDGFGKPGDEDATQHQYYQSSYALGFLECLLTKGMDTYTKTTGAVHGSGMHESVEIDVRVQLTIDQTIHTNAELNVNLLLDDLSECIECFKIVCDSAFQLGEFRDPLPQGTPFVYAETHSTLYAPSSPTSPPPPHTTNFEEDYDDGDYDPERVARKDMLTTTTTTGLTDTSIIIAPITFTSSAIGRLLVVVQPEIAALAATNTAKRGAEEMEEGEVPVKIRRT